MLWGATCSLVYVGHSALVRGRVDGPADSASVGQLHLICCVRQFDDPELLLRGTRTRSGCP